MHKTTMKRFLYILALAAIFFSSCKKYESPNGGEPHVPYQPAYEIGDYYHNDTLQGVVFLTYGAHNGLMVSLEETCLPWCETNYVNSETGATNSYDGWFNTNILMSNYDLRHFPAIQWTHQRNTWHLVHQNYPIIADQWYAPSNMELSKLLQNQAAVNNTLDSLGFPTLEDKTYWSSTELGTRSAASVHLQDGKIVISEAVKTHEYYVRAIRNF